VSGRAAGSDLRRFRRSRRRPRPTQFDYLHLKRLVEDLGWAFSRIDVRRPDVLDVYCGARPYEDMLPAGSRVVGLDVTDEHGVADVVTDEFLPFGDGRFDAVICIQAFYYVPDAARAVAEMRRILRPGGLVIMSVPHVQEYAVDVREQRFTEPGLRHLFRDWEDVAVLEDGGRAVTWATISGRFVIDVERALSRGRLSRRLMSAAAGVSCVLINGVGLLLEACDRRIAKPGYRLPPNLTLVARAPRTPEQRPV
jgi:SAM-dependent methyltransferase